ncbi:unnamed protein product [Echinostoma caproni]|uniref:Uncharacterized protein n=1 Tax=Echinostoma caproni TaxID=27848 RepID=A0A3P8FXX0_9TREM|nr:unnamed protein product [Echinostoma caproni]
MDRLTLEIKRNEGDIAQLQEQLSSAEHRSNEAQDKLSIAERTVTMLTNERDRAKAFVEDIEKQLARSNAQIMIGHHFGAKRKLRKELKKCQALLAEKEELYERLMQQPSAEQALIKELRDRISYALFIYIFLYFPSLYAALSNLDYLTACLDPTFGCHFQLEDQLSNAKREVIELQTQIEDHVESMKEAQRLHQNALAARSVDAATIEAQTQEINDLLKERDSFRAQVDELQLKLTASDLDQVTQRRADEALTHADQAIRQAASSRVELNAMARRTQELEAWVNERQMEMYPNLDYLLDDPKQGAPNRHRSFHGSADFTHSHSSPKTFTRLYRSRSLNFTRTTVHRYVYHHPSPPTLGSHSKSSPVPCRRVSSQDQSVIKSSSFNPPTQTTPTVTTPTPPRAESTTTSVTPIQITDSESLFNLHITPESNSTTGVSTLRESENSLFNSQVNPTDSASTKTPSPKTTQISINTTLPGQSEDNLDPELIMDQRADNEVRSLIRIIRESRTRPDSTGSCRSSISSRCENDARRASAETLSPTGTVILVCRSITPKHLVSDFSDDGSRSPADCD